MARRRTPQQKKELSYRKDRRDAYGENDKGSRKSVRRNKRTPVRSDRRREHQVLAEARGPSDEGGAETAESRLSVKRPRRRSQRWRKLPGRPLGHFVENRLLRRIQLGIDDPARAEQRIERVRRRRP